MGRAGQTDFGRAVLKGAGAAMLSFAAIAVGGMAGAQALQPASSGPPTGAWGAADSLFQQPYVDIDEWRETPDGKARFRYVHGGFRGTNLKFSFYMPEKARYQGRFFQYVASAPGPEDTALRGTGENNRIAFAFDSGGYLVESNMGAPADEAITGFRASAAAADYSRKLALEMYGGKRPYGYIYGGSGGGYRTMAAIENTTVWDGAVPYVIGSPRAMQIMVFGHSRAARVLKGKLPLIVDAIDAGGSGDMYAGLGKDEADALREATRMGYPPQAWVLSMNGGGFSIPPGTLPGTAIDPTYFADFWTKPGYEGTDPASYAARNRVQFATTVSRLLTGEDAAKLGITLPRSNARILIGRAGPPPGAPGFRNPVGADSNPSAGSAAPPPSPVVGLELAGVPSGKNLDGAVLRVRSGEAAGSSLPLEGLVRNVAFTGGGALARIKPGDRIEIDNSDALAADVYLRYQVPSRDYAPWDQYRDANGRPIPPQRPLQPESAIAGGAVQSGRFKAKTIVVASLVDEMAVPWNATWYEQKVGANFGAKADDSFRLWFIENAIHGDSAQSGQPTRIVSYLPVLHQALRDVAVWAEKGTPPPASTRYRVVDSQIVVPATAAARRGVQPVLTLKANGAARANVAIGQPVTFSGTIEVPPGTGEVIAAEWDFDGSGKFLVKATLVHQSPTRATATATHSFAKPGTYFGVLRATSQRQGDPNAPWGRIPNLARARVVVK